jgi:hypothetical protein
MMVLPNAIPNKAWLTATHYDREMLIRQLYGENQFGDYDADDGTPCYFTRAEVLSQDFWGKISELNQMCRLYGVYVASGMRLAGDDKTHATAIQLLKDTYAAGKGVEKFRMPGDTTLKAEDEPTMFHENMLMMCYSQMEVCRGLTKLTDLLYEKVFKVKSKKPHPIKAYLPDNYVSDLQEATKIWFQSIRDLAQSYIELIKSRGVASIKAQVRWGDTGELLQEILSDSDVDYYAKEYVDSALAAWGGVLKVKLK